MFYIFSQDKKVVTPLLEDTLTVKISEGKFKLFLVTEDINGNNEYVVLGTFETEKQYTTCIRGILDKYTNSNGNGYYEINSAKYYNY